ncbi:MAG: efflux RND transporter periplasmic adaptor subunit [Candidatus Omnitrophica bacterium]|nr:efflux RND transporter periplasmic adaptor subunit [Candidatus Omnitrophota bacterium]MDD5430437.1 efflux RND transporter periplasmic adaptor subunit [Candidatus Omnitrophota bacterium]
MRKNKYKFVFLSLVVLAALFFLMKDKQKTENGVITEEVSPVSGSIKLSITTTGVIEPQNRLEIKPSISGRIEEILVREGDKVKKGDVLAMMSSTDRAALIDAAGSKDQETLKYWQEVYKETPVMSPINGEVIVRSVEPGQTVTTSDDILVLSDRLIVSAQFDETDIGRVKVGQNALITLDAYPDVKIKGEVDHIAYESEVVNNVNIYNVDIVPKNVPDFFRSGMSVDTEVIEREHKDVLTIPLEAVFYRQEKAFVKVKNVSGGSIQERAITTGLSDEKSVEVTTGLNSGDVLIVQGQGYIARKEQNKSNPFMPSRKK